MAHEGVLVTQLQELTLSYLLNHNQLVYIAGPIYVQIQVQICCSTNHASHVHIDIL